MQWQKLIFVQHVSANQDIFTAVCEMLSPECYNHVIETFFTLLRFCKQKKFFAAASSYQVKKVLMKDPQQDSACYIETHSSTSVKNITDNKKC